MIFSSLTFLYVFLPLVLLIYVLVPAKFHNTVLFVSSLLFYAWGEPRSVLLLLAVVGITWGCGLFLQHVGSGSRYAKPGLVLFCAFCILLLGYFKYAGFFVDSCCAVTGLPAPVLNIALPLGISFYLFQALSYVVDVYRGTYPAERNLIRFGAYLALFPQLIAGPIVRYGDVRTEMYERTLSPAQWYSGFRRFLVGLAKKTLLANPLGALAALPADNSAPSVLLYWLAAIAYTLQIYYDFSGYSDMAIGLGQILGFSFPENFRYPYESRSITEFWRRWHITLGSWFREYVYIPLGGSRVGKARLFRNLLLVWALTGLWHGAAWNFVLWGLWYAALLILEKFCYPKISSHLYVLLATVLGFVLFQAGSLAEVGHWYTSMFGAAALPFCTPDTWYRFLSNAVLLIAGVIGCTSLPHHLWETLRRTPVQESYPEAAGMLLLLLFCTAWLVDGSYNPFLYFRF